jgi:hypothetical protein
MSAVPPLVTVLLGAHGLLVRALPADFRRRNAAEVSNTAREAVLAALAAGGPGAGYRRAGRELLDLGAVVLRLHAPLATTPAGARSPRLPRTEIRR